MRHLLFPVLFTLLAPRLTDAQGPSALISSTLPSCAQQCTVLQQAATGCTPAGGAPVANQATYQSCFCQSALLPSLLSTEAVQLCSTCPPSDMASIQSWVGTIYDNIECRSLTEWLQYKGLCGKGAGVASNPTSTSPTSSSPKATGHATSSASPGATVSNSQENTSSSGQTRNGPWRVLPTDQFYSANHS